MNVLGAVGHLMNGSGIRNLLEVIYGENGSGIIIDVIHGKKAATHILTGKAVVRTVRSYMLLDNCLNYIIIDKILMTNQLSKKNLKSWK